MDRMTLAEAQADLAALLLRIVEDRNPVIIDHGGGEPVVLAPLADFQPMDETEYLLSTPANAERLLASIAEFDGVRSDVDEAAPAHAAE